MLLIRSIGALLVLSTLCPDAAAAAGGASGGGGGDYGDAAANVTNPGVNAALTQRGLDYTVRDISVFDIS